MPLSGLDRLMSLIVGRGLQSMATSITALRHTALKPTLKLTVRLTTLETRSETWTASEWGNVHKNLLVCFNNIFVIEALSFS